MTPLLSLSIVGLAALIHASFQLSISAFTLMSGHSLGRQQSRLRLTGLINGFIIGVAVMTTLLLSTLCYLMLHFLTVALLPIIWTVLCALLLVIGVAVWVFYYRHERGTTLWLPRKTAEFLAERCKRTKNSGEAFGLGLASAFGELLFTIAPLSVGALAIISSPIELQPITFLLYVVVSLLSLLIVAFLVASGTRISAIQYWRESNKRFLQFAAGSALVVLACFLYVNEVLALPLLQGVGL